VNPDSTISVRLATIDDVRNILILERQSASASHWSEEQYEQSIRSAADAFGRLVLVAEQAPRNSAALVRGFLVARHLSPEWELENIVVSFDVQRLGIGRHLLQALFGRARETNSDAIFLEVRESNAPARALYDSAGFRQTGRRKSYYTSPLEDAILYRLDLR
jgi:ribosomal-protein-alanine N-acetyltransferase